MSKGLNKEETQEKFLNQIRLMVDYWAKDLTK